MFYLRRSCDVLRTHTTSGLRRGLNSAEGPLKAFTLGRVYRKDDGLNHLSSFTQLEGIVVCQSCSLAHIAKLLRLIVSNLLEVRFLSRLRRASFPFTCPSIELDLYKGLKFSTSAPNFQ